MQVKLQKSKQLYYALGVVGFLILISLASLRISVSNLQDPELLKDNDEGSRSKPKAKDTGTFLYFAYASDLLESRLHAGGGPSAKIVGVGRIKGKKFAFSQESKVWRGGVADIVPSDSDDEVWGVLYKLKSSDLAGLNKQKGVEKADPLYEQITVKVELQNSEAPPIEAITYSIVDSKRLPFGAAPSPQYKECLIRGAEEQGLPDSYIDVLRRIKDNGSTYKRKNVC